MMRGKRGLVLALGAFLTGTFVTSIQASCGSVASVCAQEGDCAGPQGPAGPAGPPGAEGTSPPGSIVLYAGATPPAGWLSCDGAEVARDSYPELFAAVGISFGAGDAIHTFQLPDLRGRVPVGAGTAAPLSARQLGEAGGEERHTLTIAEMPAHRHREQGSNRLNGDAGGVTHVQDVDNDSFGTVNTAETGGGQAHNTMPPYLVLGYIIKS